ncbi:MAG: YdcF family protein [Oscillospiraceae bacterium]|nr:YdcF family protein [Oscillospiraceae bacterium]MBQ9939773.1 YdcF family protein [Oscillospiraceae bacterium]
MSKIFSASFRVVLALLSAITLISALSHSVFYGFTLVSLFMTAVSLPFLALSLFPNAAKKLLTPRRDDAFLCRMLKYAVITYLCAVFAAFFVFASAMLFCAEADTPSPEADVLIVLGCKVEENGAPSLMLQKRLDAAAEYLADNPDTLVLLSGGVGEGSDTSEAAAMQKYLTKNGIAANRILLEERSANTRENLFFSAELLAAENITLDGETAIVTDGFHQLRARIWAKNAGFSNVSSLSSATPLYLFPYYFFREFMGITRYILAGY